MFGSFTDSPTILYETVLKEILALNALSVLCFQPTSIKIKFPVSRLHHSRHVMRKFHINFFNFTNI